ncbi:MAG: MATE family efflux transporter, partial [Clostridia bacterium]|nr:MATE family efflux transporter [Clostridia bacterium]
TSTVNWLVSSTISALGVGFLAYIAQSLGAGDEKSARRASAQAVLAVLVSGIFFTIVTVSLSGMVPVWMQVDTSIQTLAATYFMIVYMPMLPRAASIIFGTVLRAAGDTKTPMKVGIMMNIINIVLNFLLIYETRAMNIFGMNIMIPGAGMGVIGAAVGSAVSFTVGGLYITWVLFTHKKISPKGISIKPDGHILKPCMKVAFPNMLQRFGTSMGYVAFASMINSLGEVATAAHTIANTVESLFYIPGYGMQTAAATLAGNAYGAGDRERMNDLAAIMMPIEIGLMAISGAALFAVAPTFMGIFSKSEEVINLGATVLRMVAVSEPFFGYSIIMEGLMQGVGKTKEPFIFNIAGMWLIRICFTYVCTQMLGMGLVSAWACMIAHNIFLCMMFAVCQIKGTWNPLNKAV